MCPKKDIKNLTLCLNKIEHAKKYLNQPNLSIVEKDMLFYQILLTRQKN